MIKARSSRTGPRIRTNALVRWVMVVPPFASQRASKAPASGGGPGLGGRWRRKLGARRPMEEVAARGSEADGGGGGDGGRAGGDLAGPAACPRDRGPG